MSERVKLIGSDVHRAYAQHLRVDAQGRVLATDEEARKQIAALEQRLRLLEDRVYEACVP